MSQHITRKELKQDKFRESLEHGAEAVISHKTFATVVIGLVAAIALATGGWRIYTERRTGNAAAALDEASRVYNARIRAAGEPAEPGELTYPNEALKMQDAAAQFTAVGDKYPSTNPGQLARYYAALCFESLERPNQALESLKKIEGSNDKELATLAQYQSATIYARTGKADEAVKIYRALAEKPSAFVPRSLALLELAALLRTRNPKEAADIYAQIKKEFPDTAIAEEAERNLEALPPS